MKRLKPKIMKVMVYETLNVYTQFKTESPLTVTPLYRIAYATLPNSEQLFTIYDDRFSVNKGFSELSLKVPSKHFINRLENSGSWKPLGQLFVVTYPFDVRKAMASVKWNRLLDYLVDDTGRKSPVLTEIAKSHLIPFKEQTLNNNGIILTNPNTGKSTTYRNITGAEPSADVSEAGLFGSAEQAGKGWRSISGSLEGEGLAVFDEFPEHDYAVVNRMLSYLESGKTVRTLVIPVECSGSKTIVFLGNYEGLNENDFIKNIIGLATGKSLDRVGRRFAHIVFDELEELEKSTIDEGMMLDIRTLARYSIDFARRRIAEVFDKNRRWMGQIDEDYRAQVMEVAELCNEEKAKVFLRGCSINSPRLKCAAVKRAVIEHLDKLVLSRNFQAVYDVIKPDILRFYDMFKGFNMESFYNFRYDKVMFFKKEYREDMSKDELESLAKKIGVSSRTLYRWKKVPEKRYNPWKEEKGGWKTDVQR